MGCRRLRTRRRDGTATERKLCRPCKDEALALAAAAKAARPEPPPPPAPTFVPTSPPARRLV
jgi:hypothetical protein